MRKITIALAITLATVCMVMLAMTADADAGDLGLLDLRELYIDARQYTDGGHYPLITENGIPNGRDLDKELNLVMKTDVLHYFYWDSTIHSMTDQTKDHQHGQFRLIGLEFGFGVRLSSTFEVGYYHFSQHLMDASFPYHFPVQDAIQLKIYLFRDKTNRDSIF